MQAVKRQAAKSEHESLEQDFKIDYTATYRFVLLRIQKMLTRKETELKVKLYLIKKGADNQLKAFQASSLEEAKVTSCLCMKMKVITAQTFGMMPQGRKAQ